MLALSSQPQPLAIAAHAQLARTSVSALSLTLASSAFAASTSAASAPTASSDVTCSHDQLLALLEESSPDASNHRATYEPSQRPGVGRSGPAAAGGEVLLVHRDSGGVQALLRLQSAERVPRRHHPAPARHRRSGPEGLNSQ